MRFIQITKKHCWAATVTFPLQTENQLVKVGLIDTANNPYSASDTFLSDIDTTSGGIIASATITNTTITDGLFDGRRYYFLFSYWRSM